VPGARWLQGRLPAAPFLWPGALSESISGDAPLTVAEISAVQTTLAGIYDSNRTLLF